MHLKFIIRLFSEDRDESRGGEREAEEEIRPERGSRGRERPLTIHELLRALLCSVFSSPTASQAEGL